MSEATTALLRLLAVIAIIAALYFFGDRLVDTIQAPAELNAALGNNAALKAGADAQRQGIETLKTAADAKRAQSKAAVNAAGGARFKRAEEISTAPPVGETDYERAVNRIDRELGLR